MAQILEAMMVIAFGMAWPASILKSWQSRTARGKSLFFLCVVDAGYLCGIASKFVGGVNYVLIFYILNFFMVTVDIVLHFRNLGLDEEAGR